MSRATPTSISPTLSKIRSCRSYPPTNEHLITLQVDATLHSYPTLHATTQLFTSSSGKSQPLVALRGTIPVQYRNATYKIPVHIWLMPYHPSGPPLIFVVPTRAMVFRKGHPHVDGNGLVYLPYLHGWNERSSLVHAVAAVVQAFSIKPPVYARPDVKPAMVERPEDRKALVEKLRVRLAAAMKEGERKVRDAKLAKETNRKLLQARREHIGGDGEVGELRKSLVETEKRRQELEKWAEMHPVGVDELRYRHVLTEQEVGCRAKDLALMDALGVLDRVQGISVEAYLNRVRGLSREMFFERLLLKKVRRQMAVVKKEAEQRHVHRRASVPVPERRMSEVGTRDRYVERRMSAS